MNSVGQRNSFGGKPDYMILYMRYLYRKCEGFTTPDATKLDQWPVPINYLE